VKLTSVRKGHPALGTIVVTDVAVLGHSTPLPRHSRRWVSSPWTMQCTTATSGMAYRRRSFRFVDSNFLPSLRRDKSVAESEDVLAVRVERQSGDNFINTSCDAVKS